MRESAVRVLFVMSDLGGGGAEKSLLELLCRLDRRRIHPSLFLLRRAGVHLDQVPADVELSWGCESVDRLRYHLPFILGKVTAQGARADVIVGAIETTASYVAWLAASVLRKPLVGWVRTDLDEYLAPTSSYHRWMARQMYPRCAAVVAASDGSLHSLRRVAEVHATRLHKIHNPVDGRQAREMAAEPLPPAMRQLLSKPFILSVGRLDVAHKGFDTLINAHTLVRGRGIDHNLVILGDGKDRSLLEQYARSLNVESSVFLPGFQRNPFPFFRAARALAAPSRLEGFGRTFLEAMALGVPVIGSMASGPAEILEMGKFGINVPADSPERLADAMYSLLTDAETHARYSKLSLERVLEYRPEDIALQWDDLLNSLA